MKQLDKTLEILNKNSLQNLKSILKNSSDIIGTEIASIFILDIENQELWSIVSLDNAIIKIDSRLGIAGEAIAKKKTIVIDNAYEESHFYRKVDSETRIKTKNIITTPVIDNENHILGTLQFLNKKEGRFTNEDKLIVESTSNQVAGTLINMDKINSLKMDFDKKFDELDRLRSIIKSKFSTKNIIGTSEPIQNNIRTIEQIANSPINVLITGESGTGKELIAKAIHYSGKNAHKPFVAVNCAAIPENLIESELFGIEKGVATGVTERIGKFEEANGGTIFLDEIGDLPPEAQAKILRVLQENQVQRVGSRIMTNLDIRVISATNKDLNEEINNGNFREDLYFRLNVVNLSCPSLREIPDDIPKLLNHFLQYNCKDNNKTFSSKSIEILCNYNWPGNIRELENFIKGIIALTPQSTIKPEHLPNHILNPKTTKIDAKFDYKLPLKHYVENLEKKVLADYLQKFNNNQVRTSKALGISRQNLINKIKKYKLDEK